MENNTNKGGKIVLLIFLLICSCLGIAAFVMSLTRCKKDGFADVASLDDYEYEDENEGDDVVGSWA